MARPVLIFDLDGTLTDPALGITNCIAYALERIGAPVPGLPVLRSFIGPPLRATFLSLLGNAETADRALELYRERFSVTGLFENVAFPDVLPALKRLEPIAGSMFIATSKPHVYARRIADHFEFSRFFRQIYGCELNGDRADKSELIAHLLEEEKIEPAHAVMIGDRSHDIVGARANGLRSIGVTWGFGSVEELTDAGATHICHSFDELVHIIEAPSRA